MYYIIKHIDSENKKSYYFIAEDNDSTICSGYSVIELITEKNKEEKDVVWVNVHECFNCWDDHDIIVDSDISLPKLRKRISISIL